MPLASQFRIDERAVSPVIATILMVAVTVVLGAGLYVIVNGITQPPAHTAPRLELLAEPNSPGTPWIVRIIATTTDTPGLDAFRFLVTLPNATTVTIATGGNQNFANGVDTYYATLHATAPGDLLSASSTYPGATTVHLRIQFYDVSGDDVLNAFDELRVDLDGSDADALYDDALRRGEWGVVIVHLKSDGIAGDTTRELT